MQTELWYDNYRILFENPDEFYPSYDMNLIDKLNAIMRLSLYIGIILTLITFNYLYLYIPIGIGVFTILIYRTQKNNVEKFFSDYDKMVCGNGEPCIEPTVDNPFMNFNNITDARDRAPACKSYDNSVVKKKIEENFNHNLYRDVGDLYSKNNSQREFYTMPVSTGLSSQTEFAKWCYGTGQNCKENSIACAVEWSPIKTDQIFENVVNN
jgi:hypothetical protein